MTIYRIDGSFLMEVKDLKTDLAGKDLRDANLFNADLTDADLRHANLFNANLFNADLRDANLFNANLTDANLFNANLFNANLFNADLTDADLSNANLRFASLRNADLKDANLKDANLFNADLKDAKYNSKTRFPSPGQMLLANWGKVSDKLTNKLMNYDCQNHPVGKKAFDEWVETNVCPYDGCKYQRAVNFIENKDLWKHTRTKYSALSLVKELMKEKMIKVD